MNKNDLIRENKKLKARIAELEGRNSRPRGSVVRQPPPAPIDTREVADDLADEVLG